MCGGGALLISAYFRLSTLPKLQWAGFGLPVLVPHVLQQIADFCTWHLPLIPTGITPTNIAPH